MKKFKLLFRLKRSIKRYIYTYIFIENFDIISNSKLVQFIEKERADPKFKKKTEPNEKKLPYYETAYKQIKQYGIIKMFDAESFHSIII